MCENRHPTIKELQEYGMLQLKYYIESCNMTKCILKEDLHPMFQSLRCSKKDYCNCIKQQIL